MKYEATGTVNTVMGLSPIVRVLPEPAGEKGIGKKAGQNSGHYGKREQLSTHQ